MTDRRSTRPVFSERRTRIRRQRRLAAVGALLTLGVVAGLAVWLVAPWSRHTIASRTSQTTPTRQATTDRTRATPVAASSQPRNSTPHDPAARALALPSVDAGPVPGYVLIADRNNNRLLIISPSKHIVWRFPGPAGLPPGTSFRDPDDAFFTPDYRSISTNEEFNDQIAQISLSKKRIVWTYGKAGIAGSAAGELSNPDDAYVLPDGDFLVADIQNCRVLTLNRQKRIVHEIGTAGSCAHDPPRTLLAPNGATPLPDGGVLVTEIGGYVDRIDASGRLVFSIRTPTTYPSDAQLLPDGNVLVAGFNTPGRIDVITPSGKIVWTYGPSSGHGSLDRPSLAVRWPNGMIAVTDDWHHRIVVIDPKTKRIVWQYGRFGVASSAPGFLSKPDGLDLLPAAVQRSTATANQSARKAQGRLAVTTIGRLPAPASRLAAVALPGGRVLALGGLVGGASSDQVLLGPPGRLRPAGRLPAPTHDAAATLAGQSVRLFGGGQTVSTASIVSVSPATGSAHTAGKLDEPLSDLGAATLGGETYLVGGYTGTAYASAVLAVSADGSTTTVARLPTGLRYAGVAALAGHIYVVGGSSTTGESTGIYSIEPIAGTVREIGRLPAPVAHAPLVALDGALFLIGGTGSDGAARNQVLRIDPNTGKVTVVAQLATQVADAAAVALNGRIIVLGGTDGAAQDGVLALTPMTGR